MFLLILISEMAPLRSNVGHSGKESPIDIAKISHLSSLRETSALGSDAWAMKPILFTVK